jgi:hypothetical protein
MSKYKIKKTLVLLTIYSILSITGCGQNNTDSADTGTATPTSTPVTTQVPVTTQDPVATEAPVVTEAPAPADTATPVPGEEWKSNLGTIDLTNLRVSGTGVTVDGTTIRITAGGDFTVTGTLDNGKIVISTADRVKLRLSGASLTCNNDSAIFVEKADKAFITMESGTTNTLSSAGTEEAAIYSKDDLEIKGNGTLTIVSRLSHGIKASDDLNIENGTLNITAARDGIHTNETCDISGGTITITAVKDGIESEENLIIRGGNITITAKGQEYTAAGEMNIDESKATITIH